MELKDRQHIELVTAGTAGEAAGDSPDWRRHTGRWEGEVGISSLADSLVLVVLFS